MDGTLLQQRSTTRHSSSPRQYSPPYRLLDEERAGTRTLAPPRRSALLERAETRFHLLPSGPAPATGQPQHDVVLVMPAPGSAEQQRRRRLIAAKAKAVGLEAIADVSRDEDEILLRLSAPDALLEKVAESTRLAKRLSEAHGGGYADYTIATKSEFRHSSDESFFSSLERIQLLLALLTLSREEGGAAMHLEQEINDGILSAVVPIHEIKVAETVLMEAWCKAPLRLLPQQPLDDIRDYFGERIAFYFAFVQHTCSWLVPLAVLGALVLLSALLYFGSMDNPLIPLYSVCTLLWWNVVLKTWRRAQARLAFRWHSEDFAERERTRADFQGPEARGFYTRHGCFVPVPSTEANAQLAPLVRRFTPHERVWRLAASSACILPMLLTVVIGTSAVLAYKTFLMWSFFLSFSADGRKITTGRAGVLAGERERTAHAGNAAYMLLSAASTLPP